MMMKKLNNYIMMGLIALSLVSSGCNDWLDVNPKSEIKAEDLFEKESGFREALFGVYTKMSANALYGGNLTMSFLDVLAQNYSINLEEQPFYYASIYDYDYEQGRINSIWNNMYNSIANCNNLLENLEGKEELFSGDNYQFFLAETKALRAYLHFDVLRMFAPSVARGAAKPAIPFVDQVRTTPFPQLTVQQVLDRVITELKEAQRLLKDVDPIGPAFDEYSESKMIGVDDYINDDGFLLFRKSRMNYYAVTGLLARVYLYKGDKENALLAAREVIESTKFEFVTEDKLVSTKLPDILFFDEILFALYNDNILDKSKRYFKNKADDELIITDDRKNLIYESGEEGLIDYRARYHFGRNEGELQEYVIKYREVQAYSPSYLPMLRLSEMYYIAAECEPDKQQALSYVNTVRVNRGYEDYTDIDMLNVQDELYKEYRKEFIAEGQMFYFIKRLNYTDIEFSSVEGTDAVYVLPIPDNELEFGDIN